jgi:hypothetical protein
MVCASSIANFGIMVQFLVEMCIITRPTTFVTSVFLISTQKMHFPFSEWPKGAEQLFFVK